MEKKKAKPSFDEEKKLWKRGFDFVIGVDEVGRGAFAGPVTVGTVVFARPKIRPKVSVFAEINDSKLLNPGLRKWLSLEIKKLALHWSITSVGVSKINKVGIGKATKIAFRKAVKKLLNCYIAKIAKNNNRSTVQHLYNISNRAFLLVDGLHIRYLRGIGLKNQKAIIKGDRKSISIAAASVIAKVYRDDLMRKLHRKFPAYSFAKNKGYGTKEHQNAIKKYGLSKVHRISFALKKFTASR